MIFGNNNFWLGTRESYQSALALQTAKADGTLLKLQMENPTLDAQSRMNDDEDYRIGDALIQVVEGVAVITIHGGLVSAYAWYNSWFGVVSYEEIRDALVICMEDDNIKKILLDVDSGGGSVANLDELSEFIHQIDTRVKPVYGHTTSCACSAAYWLLSSCRHITASKAAITGSIGVIMTTSSIKGMYDEAGIEFHYIRSGKFKALGQQGEEFSEEAEAEAFKLVSGLHKFFVAQVIDSRGSKASMKQDAWGSGKVFLSEEALALGLIDEINTFDSCIAKLYKSSNNSNIVLKTDKSKDFFMKILTAAQLAKFQSGVPIEQLGLSADALAKAKEIAARVATKFDSAGASAEPTQDVEAVEDVDTSADEKVTSEINDSSSADNSLMTTNAELNKANGKLEGKIELADKALVDFKAESETKLAALTATQVSLLAIAVTATNKLQVAIGASATDLTGADAATVISQHTTASDSFTSTFSIGAASNTPSSSRAEQNTLQPQHAIKKVK